MGIARHDDINMGAGLVHDRLLKLEDTASHLPDDVTEIEPEVQGDLVIPAPCGMELLAYRADLLQPPQNGRKLPLLEDAYFAEHLCMGDTPLDVIFVEALIKGD